MSEASATTSASTTKPDAEAKAALILEAGTALGKRIWDTELTSEGSASGYAISLTSTNGLIGEMDNIRKAGAVWMKATKGKKLEKLQKNKRVVLNGAFAWLLRERNPS